jgi:hypothetical protein
MLEMHLRGTIRVNALIVILPVLGLERYLTITALQTAFHAIQGMPLPAITQDNVPTAMIRQVDGRIHILITVD